MKQNKNISQSLSWSCRHTWKNASYNTLWCLLGCSIGDFGTIFFFQVTKIAFPVMGIMILAIINGLITSIILETFIFVLEKRVFSFFLDFSYFFQYFWGVWSQIWARSGSPERFSSGTGPDFAEKHVFAGFGAPNGSQSI